jgi:hypothetical protein
MPSKHVLTIPTKQAVTAPSSKNLLVVVWGGVGE